MASFSSPGWGRTVAFLCAGLCVALTLVAFFGDLNTAGQVASIAGAVVSAVALAFSWTRSPEADGGAAGARSVQAGGDIGRAVTGDRNRLAAPPPSPPASGAPPSAPPSAPPARPPGARGVSAAGGIGEAVTGDDNTQP